MGLCFVRASAESLSKRVFTFRVRIVRVILNVDRCVDRVRFVRFREAADFILVMEFHISTALRGVEPGKRMIAPKPNVVLVHGAWGDGSHWSHAIPPLHAKGYRTSLAGDVDRTSKPAAA